MAFAATDLVSEPRSFSLGPLKMQVLTYSALSGDTSGSVVADRLQYATAILIDGGLQQTAAATFSGNTVTLAFNDPAASIYGSIVVLGR